jgi:transglutaminase-like putative cysteine protease
MSPYLSSPVIPPKVIPRPVVADATVRVGCHLTYYSQMRMPLMVLVRPQADERQLILSEEFVTDPSIEFTEFEDLYGNVVLRGQAGPGIIEIHHDALVSIPCAPDNHGMKDGLRPLPELPGNLLRYTLPSRYCDSDKLIQFAWNQFGSITDGLERVQAICNWVHDKIEYRFGSGDATLSASEVLARRYGVCRDFAHVAIALCRAVNLPARYVTGHLPDIGFVDPGSPMDFHAYFEVYIGNRWYTYDARYNVPRIGRVKVAHGLDAVDTAFSTCYGPCQLTSFTVWAYQVDPQEVKVGDPIDLTKRLDGTMEVRLPAIA